MPTHLQKDDILEIYQSAENQLFYIAIRRWNRNMGLLLKVPYSKELGEGGFSPLGDNVIYESKDKITEIAEEAKIKIDRLKVGDIKLDIIL